MLEETKEGDGAEYAPVDMAVIVGLAWDVTDLLMTVGATELVLNRPWEVAEIMAVLVESLRADSMELAADMTEEAIDKA